MAGKRRGFETLADMGRSLGVTLLFVAFLVGAVALGRSDVRPDREVDYVSVLNDARQAAPYHLLAPEGLGEGWHANGATYEPGSDGARWHVGFIGPKGTYIGVDQSDGDVAAFLDRLLAGYVADGSVTIAGQPWDRRHETGDRHNDRALVRVSDGVATVVIGTGSYEEIEYFVGLLR